jgi:hypothetical protein
VSVSTNSRTQNSYLEVWALTAKWLATESRAHRDWWPMAVDMLLARGGEGSVQGIPWSFYEAA